MQFRIDVYHHMAGHQPDAVLAELATIKGLIMTTQAEFAAQLSGVADQLTKATAEIIAAAAAAGVVSPELEAAGAKLKSLSQALDDLNPDAAPAP